jgi:SSS family transporter
VNNLATVDIAILVIYAIGIFLLAQWVSREKGEHKKDAQDYFLASRALPWWAIGTSLIAANISAEQIVGMSGSGYVMGMAIASYEWMAALTLIVVGKWILPVFLKNGIYTMPEFLERRYSPAVRTVMAIFWLVLYIFVNLTSILWLGSLAVNAITGLELQVAITGLALFALLYALYGGLKAVALTDIVQVSLLVAGGIIITWISLDTVGGDAGVIGGFKELTNRFPEKFDMILSPDNPHYKDLPGLAVLLGGMWMMNVSYWGFNQYIIQRGLAAKSVNEAQKGIVLAAFLKLIMPAIIVLPGIAALVLSPGLERTDQAYPSLMATLPVGHQGPGVRGAGCGDRGFHRVQDQFHRDHLHDGPVPCGEAADRSADPREGRTHRRDRVDRHRDLHYQALPEQLQPGLPVHPGLHRFRHAGNLRDLPARTVLGAHHLRRGHDGGAGHGADVGGISHLAAGLPVHEPRWLVLCRRYGAGSGDLAGDSEAADRVARRHP